jgi:hypothetical protein
MKSIFVVALIFFAQTRPWAQIGITAAPTLSASPEWQILLENFISHRHTDFLPTGTTAVADYILPIRPGHWRLQPALHYMYASMQVNQHRFRVLSFGLQGNIAYDLLRSEGKTAPFLPGKLFVQLSPAFDWVKKNYDRPVYMPDEFEYDYEEYSDGGLAFNAGISLVYEFTLSKLLSLSPTAGVRVYPKLPWEGLGQQVSGGSFDSRLDQTDWRHYFFGVRLGLHFKNDD